MERLKFLENALNLANRNFTVRESRDIANTLDIIQRDFTALQKENEELKKQLDDLAKKCEELKSAYPAPTTEEAIEPINEN